MSRVNVSMSEELHRRARAARLNISQLTQQAVAAELDRLSKIAALDAYLAELDTVRGPLSASERTEAGEWADRVVGDPTPRRRSA